MEAKTDWERCAEFHGHVCPGLAVGYRAAKVGLQELAANRDVDEELVAIVENDACGVDAAMLLTGCTLGKGNLIFRNYGKHAFTFMNRASGKGVRVSVNPASWQRDEQQQALRAKVFSGAAGEEERRQFARNQQQAMQQILDMPQEEFCKVQQVEETLPTKARIFNSFTCAYCGESVSESRARMRDGKPACIPCAGEYSRGW